MRANINIVWAEWLLEECYRHGVRELCIAPGSRSAPLTLAAAKHANLRCVSHFDERGLGFFALGLAKQSERCVALITTSGTAVANLYPAVVEARQMGVNLLILSADRPHELHHSGANQTIIQQGIFADYPVFQQSLACPELKGSPIPMFEALAQGFQAQRQQAGVIHLNCPFREPFYPQQAQQEMSSLIAPLQEWRRATAPWQALSGQASEPRTHGQWSEWQQAKVVVVIGRQAAADVAAISAWAELQAWPVLCDVQAQGGSKAQISQAELLLQHPELQTWQPQLIIQFGGFLVGKRLLNWLGSRQAEQWYIDDLPLNHNPQCRPQQRWVCGSQAWLAAHPAQEQSHHAYVQQWRQWQQALHSIVEAALTEYSELALAASIDRLSPAQAPLFLGNSMVIRLFELLGLATQGQQVYANRGASGIDGLLATGLGIAKGCSSPTTIVLGDTSLLHDLNSLSLAKHCQQPVVAVVVNNHGGEIFKLLPDLGDEQVAERYFQVPTAVDFQAQAASFGLKHQQVDSIADFESAYSTAMARDGFTLIEVVFASGDASQRYRDLCQQVKTLRVLD